MRKAFLLLMLFMPVISHAGDLHEYLKETGEMVNRGQYQEALDRFIWFHDHSLEHEPAMAGVRLSFALSSWKCLADKYRPAYDAMVQIRDRKTDLLLSEKPKPSLFYDVAALNSTLGEDERTVELFERLDAERPGEAKECWIMAKDALYSAKRYDLIRKYLRNPATEFVRIKAMFDMSTSLYDDERFKGSPLKESNEKRFIEESLRLIEITRELDPVAAQDIQRKALSVIDDVRLRNALPIQDMENSERKKEPEASGAR